MLTALLLLALPVIFGGLLLHHSTPRIQTSPRPEPPSAGSVGASRLAENRDSNSNVVAGDGSNVSDTSRSVTHRPDHDVRAEATAGPILPANFLDRSVTGNKRIAFTLPDGQEVRGEVQLVKSDGNGILYVQADIKEPAAGFCFMQRQTMDGVAGPLAGHVRFEGNDRAWKIEPTAELKCARFVDRVLDEVLCINYEKRPDVMKADAPGDVQQAPQTHPTNIPFPTYQTVIPLQSLPGATGVLYLDFDGEEGPFAGWSGGYFVAAPSGASNAEVFDVWKMVCEDYQGFNLNVTTDRKVFDAAAPGHRQQIIITPTDTVSPGGGGIAYVSSFNWSDSRVCWSFATTGKEAAEIISHELGHTLGLFHDGPGYNEGHGSGPTGWAPIMGAAYYQNLSQWSKGEYLGADNTQDDLSVIANNNNDVGYRPDDSGDTLATARYLDILANGSASNEGIIETTGDVDAFRFRTTKSGKTTLTVKPVDLNPNLDIYAEIVNAATMSVVSSNNPDLAITATVTVNNLPAGEYLLRVRGTGRGDPLVDGYTNYGCLGSYFISGTVANAVVANRFSIAENQPNGTVIGTVAARASHGTSVLIWAIASGNTNGAFAINSATGAITVANSAALNYEALSTRWDDPADFEHFVTITDSLNSALNESIRTVVSVTDVNEAPVITGGTVTMLESNIGTYVAAVSVSDPDRFDYPTMSIVSGDPGGVFAIDPATGIIRTATATHISQNTDYVLTVRAVDQGSPAISSTAIYTIHLIKYVPVYSIRGDGKVLATFSGSGSGTWTVPAWVTSMEVLVVGGGGGANSHGSGGGAGGLYSTTFTAGNLPSGSVSVAVGAGGVGATAAGANGELSQFGSIIAYGGQGMSGYDPTDGIGGVNHGGNQGGYSINGGSDIIAGNLGGTAVWDGGYNSGGGAGALGVHGNGSAGGRGVQVNITGSNIYYAGGGGATCDGPGGLGGGGTGGQTLPSQDGAANTGGGAGGGYLESARGASGGSGVVILAYNSCTVSFNSNGGSTVSSQYVIPNSTATQPTPPTWTGHAFAGWYSDSALTTAFNFSTPITGNTTIYAKWMIASYTLAYSASSNGTIEGTTPQTVTYLGSGTAVTAKPNSGYQFVKWSDNSTLNPRIDSNVSANITVTASFVQLPPPITPNTAVLRGDGKTVATFSTVGSGTWTLPAGVTSVEILVVGGGGGASSNSSGGGAGGLYSSGAYMPSGSSVTIIVGTGGAGLTISGANGGLSQFDSIIAYGGQGVKSAQPTDGINQAGQLAYHGGNQGGVSTNGGVTLIPGKPGGGSYAGFTGQQDSGGGSGAAGSHNNGSAGGIGVQCNITGINTYYAGGGGAKGSGPGGSGGGGKGGNIGVLAIDGGVNTGGGAGGGYSATTGASGGSGVVIVAYQANAYASWAGASGYQLRGGPSDDDDGDGLTNYQEYAFGLDPTRGSSCNPVRHLGGAHFTYTRQAGSGLSYSVWTSTNLKDWNGPAAVNAIVGSADAKGVETVDVTLTSPPAGSSLFLRVQAQ